MSSSPPSCKQIACQRERILFGSDWLGLSSSSGLSSLLGSASFVAVVTDVTVEALYGHQLLQSLQSSNSSRRVALFALPEGELSKQRLSKELLEDWLLQQGAARDSLLVALGGGVVGDLVGFVAATFMRGVPYIQVPTTLLAMVDSSVGGKTAVDVPAGKNLIGAFHHPVAVCVDIAFLRTLPARQFSNGMAEIIKVAVAMDEQFFSDLESPVTAARMKSLDEATLLRCIEKAISLKACVIDEDERDGRRRNILNAGHTVGHGIEAVLAPRWLHGECVSIGLIVEAFAALGAGVLSSVATIERLKRVLKMFGLPIVFPFSEVDLDVVFRHMSHDKKNVGKDGGFKCVFLSGIGRVGDAITYSAVEKDLRMLMSPSVTVSPIAVSSAESPSESRTISVSVPGSKSVSNRALILAALGSGESSLHGLLHADDTYVTLDALSALSIPWRWDASGSVLTVTGSGGQLSCAPGCEIYLGNAGTASRFLCAAACWLPVGQSVVLKGSERLHERPIAPLVVALRNCGIRVDFLGKDGHFPVRVHGNGGLPADADVVLDSTLSSQFTSAILMAVPRNGGKLTLVGKQVSQPYVRMTIEMMKQFGVAVESASDFASHAIPRAVYKNPRHFVVEADASTATYPLAVAAVTGRDVTVTNIGSQSTQGDAGFCRLLEKMGCVVEQTATSTRVRGPQRLTALGTIDMEDQTDAFMTMACVAALAEGETRIVGIGNQRVKECDRIAAMVLNLNACGIEAGELPDGIRVVGTTQNSIFSSTASTSSSSLSPAAAHIQCFKDHRIAMSFAVLSCAFNARRIVILDKHCVEKTFPEYWQFLMREFRVSVTGLVPSREHLSVAKKEDTRSLSRADCRSVVLIGMRGAGKSSLGNALSSALGMKFFDADVVFAERTGLDPKAFSAQNGMAAFREQEARVLGSLLLNEEARSCVISCGGGIVETEQGRAQLEKALSSHLVVHVRRTLSAIEETLSADANRITLNEPLSATWERRLPWFESLSHVEFFHDTWNPEALVRLVSQSFQWAKHAFRLGPGTVFSCLTSSTYRPIAASEEVKNSLRSEPCDVLEFRADLLDSCSLASDVLRLELCAARRLFPSTPFLFTLRSVADGGKFTGANAEYVDALRFAVRSGCEMIDIEANRATTSSEIREFVNWAQRLRPRVCFVFSKHLMGNDAPRPSVALLREMAMHCRAVSPTTPAILKIVAQAHEPSDAQVLQEFLRHCSAGGPLSNIAHSQSPGIVALLAGAHGRLTRVLCPLLAPCAFANLSAAAPGQLTAANVHALRAQLGCVDVGKFFLFGQPIQRSPSPTMHNAAFSAIGVSQYLRYELCETSSLEEVLRRCDDPCFVGGNVTIPLKERVYEAMDDANLSDSARAIGSVNTIWRDRGSGTLKGDNTDWRAIWELLRRTEGLPKTGVRVVVIGAGGTARSACFAASQLSCVESIVIVNRTVGRAEAVARSFSKMCSISAVGSLDQVAQVPHAVISTVPAAASSLLPASWVASGSHLRVALEAAYWPRHTAMTEQLRQHASTVRIIEGWEMLLEQGIFGWQIWCQKDAPSAEMKRAVIESLEKNTV